MRPLQPLGHCMFAGAIMSQPTIRTVLIAALGGEGGGVLTDWLVQCARHAGLAVQATSVPGVAQRTGATSYYLEFTLEPCAPGVQPVFALSPAPAGVDVVVASELLEAARMMERGFVTPERTVLVASTSRVYTTLEKMQPHDGRYDASRVIDLSRALSRQSHWMDMAEMTERHASVVSAVMFGALAGSGALPWSKDVCLAVIRASGKGVSASEAAFNEAHARVGHPDGAAHSDASRSDTQNGQEPVSPSAWTANLPLALREMAEHGVARCLDYQDAQLAQDYMAHLHELVQATSPRDREATAEHAAFWKEAARHLALWLCYEDIIRVADLKTRPERFAQVRAQAHAKDAEVVRITEHFKPGIEEVASILPRGLGQWLLDRGGASRYWGLHIRSNSLWGYLMLRGLANLRRWRRGSLRHSQEQAARQVWWHTLCQLAPRHLGLAQVLAGLPQVLKGYGDTQVRGRAHYQRLWDAHVLPALHATSIDEVQVQSFAQALQQALSHAPSEPTQESSHSTSARPVLWLKPNAAQTASSSHH